MGKNILMNNSIKILLTINLEGGALTRQSKATITRWSHTSRDLYPDKNWAPGEGYDIVEKGTSKHYDLVGKGALQRVKLTKDAYDSMISDDCPESIRKNDWMRMSHRQRLEYHLFLYSRDFGGTSFNYSILEDE